MANMDDYLTGYREFFEYFAQTVNPNDQLPVKLASYKLVNVEVVGGIIDWTTQYLSQKKCPPHLFSPLIKIIIEEIRKECKKQPVHYGFNPTDNAYEPLKLMQTVMAKTNEVCLRYLDNSMLCSLPAPTSTCFPTSVFAMRNRRKKMEDRHVVIHDLNTMFNIQEASPSSYYAVFDGHAGHDAAAYSSAHLHQFLAENKYFISNPEQALLDTFCKTDAMFLEKCKVEDLSSGTTAVVALLRPKEKTLYIAWVGDSQALLVNQGRVLQCVNPHKPCREDERARIEKSGGCVMLWGIWRVNGQLAVSRAIGDADYKPSVIAIPDVREISLDGGEDFLILACDGLWDYLTEDAAAQEVYYMIAENPDDTERISKHLVQLARYQGSTDNISVIVVFLREPHKIAAEAHRWATRNGPLLPTMEAGLDNANNPFTNSNGSVGTDNIHLQKQGDGLLLNLTDNFKANGTDISSDFFVSEKSNGKKSSSEFDQDDDFGPETNVDAVDDATLSPVEKTKGFSDELGLTKTNNNPLEEDFNPFSNKDLSILKEAVVAEPKEQSEDFDDNGEAREETPTPPVDTVHDVGGLEENPAESDSEDEWNYFKGDQADKETISSQPDTVVESLEDSMSQLNPNAAEFVPVSPTRSIPSPACRTLINDEVLAQSPKRPVAIDIKVPKESDFESEVKSRPSEVDAYSNGHNSDSEHNISGTEIMDSILNGKSIDEIPEFQPGSTPSKGPLSEEFHFGPNAAPFTPKPLDQSEALSTKALFGDESVATLTGFNESEITNFNKENNDPMSMSFYAEKGDSNPFEDDLNKVHDLPENLDDFLSKPARKSGNLMDDTISDLPEHFPLGKPADNDQAIETTDLDKLSQDDEKELASPLEPEQDIEIEVAKEDDLPENKSPEPTQVNLLDDFVVCEKPVKENTVYAEVHSERESKSPLPVELSKDFDSKSPFPESQTSNLTESELESPVLDRGELVSCGLPTLDGPGDDVLDLPHEGFRFCGVQDREGDVCGFPESRSPFSDIQESKSPVCEFKPSDMFETEFNPKTEVESYAIETKSLEVPEQTEEKEDVGKIVTPICRFPPPPSEDLESFDTQSQVDQPKEEKTEEPTPEPAELKSLADDITSSVKDDVSSPLEQLSPVRSPEQPIEDSFSEEQDIKQVESPSVVIEDSFDEEQQENVPVQMNLLEEFSLQETSNQLLSDFCTLPSKPQAEAEPLVTSNEINTILEASQPIDTSESIVPSHPLQPSQPLEAFDAAVEEVKSQHFNRFEASEFNEQISIKTDSINREFAEQAVITPSEESRVLEEVSAAPLIEVPVQEPLPVAIDLSEPIAPPPQEPPYQPPTLVPLPLPVEEPKETKKEEKKPTAAPPKKPLGKVAPSKPGAAAPKIRLAAKTTAAAKPAGSPTKTGLSPKVPSRTGTTKPSTTAKTTSTTPSPKPKTTAAPKPIERKPLTNGEIKPAPRTTLAAKKPSTEAPASKTTTRPATATKLSPLKTTAPRPATAPRTTVPRSTTAAPRPATTSAAPKPRVPLASRTTTTSASASRTTTATTTKATTATARTSPSPKMATGPPKPRTITSTVPKARVPLTKTVTKSADVEKQNKESANKLTASRTTTVTKTSSAMSNGRATSTTLKKAETKPLSHRTLLSKTTTTTKTTTKKPGEIKSVTKTKTTKVEKPKENGVAPTMITEEITIVNNVVNETENLVKDNSPIDNKLFTETPNTLIDVNPAD